jgi:hypothetical protein
MMETISQSQTIWKPHPGPQTNALLADVFELLYGGQRGGGKTETGLVWLVDPEYLKNSRYRALILRKDATDLTDWIDRAKYMYRNYGCQTVGNPVEFRFPSGAIFRLGHLKDKNSYEKYLGHEYQKILIEELTQIPQERYYEEVLGSCRSTINLKSKIFATTNPGGRGHAWVKRRFIDSAPANVVHVGEETGRTRLYIPARLEDNPSLIEKDPDYVNYLNGLKVSNPKLYKAWREGDWNVFDGQFFDKWSENQHVIKPRYELKNIPDSFSIICGLDDGTANPRSFHILIQDNDGRVEVVYEYYRSGETISEAAFNFKQQLVNLGIYEIILKRGIVYYDPSMNIREKKNDNNAWISSIDIFQNITSLKCEAAINKRGEGAKRVKEFLLWDQFTQPLLRIWDSCPKLISTLPQLVYDDKNPEDIDTTQEDHAYDSLRYGLMGLKKLPPRLSKLATVSTSNIPDWWKKVKNGKGGGNGMKNPLVGM